MATVVSGRRSQELAEMAVVDTVGRGYVEGLPTPRPLVELIPSTLQDDEFCQRLVGAFDDVVAPVFNSLDCFDSYLDPQLAPDDFVDWLAGWVGLDIDETWTVERRRRLILEAVALYRIRGSVGSLAAHIALYCGTTPEIEDNGGCSWSQTAGSELPGTPHPYLKVRLRVDESADIRRSTVSRIVDSNRPAHVPCELEVVVGGAEVEAVEDDGPPVAEGAPGAVDLPGSEHIELAPQAPPSGEELEAPPEGPSDGGEAPS
ncbi:MAG: phage tail protein [Actinomycetota bacterium]|nr:phage tail protein [Actinomycetota bacterium]